MSKGMVFCAAAFLLGAQAGLADEMWTSEQVGEIIYEADIDDVAVFSFGSGVEGKRIHIYLPGLPGRMDDRGTFDGFFIDENGGECDEEYEGPDGLKSDGWGQAIVTFDENQYPSGFDMIIGVCSAGAEAEDNPALGVTIRAES